MTLKIKLSSLTISPQAFAQAVLNHAVAMREYAAHLAGVEADAANEDLKPDERRVAFPGPSEEPLIEQAAREGFEFEGPTLDEKKAALFAEVRRMETEALHTVIPPAKVRHWQFMETDAGRRRVEGIATNADADVGFLNDQKDRRAQCDAISRRAAKLEHDIDDLTEANIDTFVLEPFVG